MAENKGLHRTYEPSSKEINESIFWDGVMPEKENFKHFYIDNGQLIVVIPYYQAAPYSLGEFEARIPLAKLR